VPADDLRREAAALIEAATTRGAIKRLAAQLDQDPALRNAVLAEGNARGADLPEDAADWPAARLLRRARAREGASQVRRNPIRRDEGFVCTHCGAAVPPAGVTARDHCPRCLRSLHVDVVPGDRAASCGGVMDPVGAELVAGLAVLRYRCRRCGAAHRVKALVDGPDPDDWAQVIAVSSQSAP
jgi:DNA-directed RNA polymerase subunit RPC12/RpoP